MEFENPPPDPRQRGKVRKMHLPKQNQFISWILLVSFLLSEGARGRYLHIYKILFVFDWWSEIKKT